MYEKVHFTKFQDKTFALPYFNRTQKRINSNNYQTHITTYHNIIHITYIIERYIYFSGGLKDKCPGTS